MVKKDKKENKTVMAIAIQPELKNELKLYSKRRDESASEFVGKLVEDALKLPIDEDPIVIAAPSKSEEFFIHYITPTLHTELKSYVEQKEMSISNYLNDLIEKAIKVSINDDPMVIGKPVNEEIIPVVLKIPANLKGQMDSLKQWIEPQISGIINILGA